MTKDTPNTTTSSHKNKRNAENKAAASFRLLLLIGMVLQNSSVVLVGRHTRTAVAKEDLYVVNHLLMVIETTKAILACLLEYLTTNGQLISSIRENIFKNPLDALKISVPALLYLIQNSLIYVALSHLSAPFFQVTYQCKLVTAALVSVVMLNRKYDQKQWICLFGLSMGVAIVVLGEQQQAQQQSKQQQNQDAAPNSHNNNTTTTENKNLFVGLVAVCIACLCSALAGVYFEKVLKKPPTNQPKTVTTTADGLAPLVQPPVSVWIRNLQLAFFSMLIATLQNIYQGYTTTLDNNDHSDVAAANAAAASKPYLHGFNGWVWVLVLLQAGGGMLVAAVLKYADTVLKGLATGVSVVVATLCSMLLFGTPLTGQFTLGSLLILASVYLFSNRVPTLGRGRVVQRLQLRSKSSKKKETPLVGR